LGPLPFFPIFSKPPPSFFFFFLRLERLPPSLPPPAEPRGSSLSFQICAGRGVFGKLELLFIVLFLQGRFRQSRRAYALLPLSFSAHPPSAFGECFSFLIAGKRIVHLPSTVDHHGAIMPLPSGPTSFESFLRFPFFKLKGLIFLQPAYLAALPEQS